MKTIAYDPKNYTIINTITYHENQFQTVKFTNGNYGIVYQIPDENIYDVIFVSTCNDRTYCDVFMEFVRNQCDALSEFCDSVHEVELHVHLNNEHSEVFKQTVSKDVADDLVERLKITNELIDLKNDSKTVNYRKLLLILCVLNFMLLIWWLIKCILT